MNNPNLLKNACLGVCLLGALEMQGGAQAALTDLSGAPLASASTTAVLPNLMFILDDSGSMDWNYLPDYVKDDNTCKASARCNGGEPPFYSAQFNGVYYNPQITYTPGVTVSALGVSTSLDAQNSASTAGWTAVREDAYLGAATVNLLTGFPEAVYGNASCASPYTSAAHCKRNGIDTGNPFNYSAADGTSATGYPDATFGTRRIRLGNPFYFTISPREYCSDANLTVCVAATAPSGANVFPAPVRFCKNSANADAAPPVSGANKCQARYMTGYTFPRYGQFTRTDITPATATYGNVTAGGVTIVDRSNRTDCAARPNCTYAEEMTNFANWYAYYRTRMQMMKSSAGLAFLPIDDRYRVGLVTINPGSPVSSARYLPIAPFNAAQKSAWYARLYGITTNGRTPLREALSRVGRHYAHITTGINSGMPEDPVEYSCQKNFALLTTDGYWNDDAGQRLNGSAIGNQDNVNGFPSARSMGAYDGNLSGASDTLADVAMYYYRADLRPSGSIGALGADVSADNVPATDKDPLAQQHMNTFTLGLVDGLVTFRPDYETATTGDFANIKNGTAGACPWAGGACNWPAPVAGEQSALDDLWHAAVNGRGAYYNARDPETLAQGLSTTLSGLVAQTGAAAASSTSSPNVTQTDRSIFSSTYRTVKWDGEVIAQNIDPVTGNVLTPIVWSAQSQLDARVSAGSDTRAIHTFDGAAANGLKPFLWGNLSATEQGYLANKCALLTQCTPLEFSAAEMTQANMGQSLLGFLRGQTQHEMRAGNTYPVYRVREHALGDTVNAKPAYVKAPQMAFADATTPDYASFKAANSARQGVLYVAANDGMLHAFNAEDATTGGVTTPGGAELWAYLPRMVMPGLYRLAEEQYATAHRYFVDGSPEVMDIFVQGAAPDIPAWKTILVGGLNAGGRGFYALDVTTPSSPKALWEICSDSTLCAISDPDIGYSYGNPVITKRASDGRWVVLVASGYNNVAPGTGRGYLFVLDAVTGAILNKIDTGAGSTATPSGLSRISAWANNAIIDNTARFVYGGDLLGNMWRFDLTTAVPGVVQIASLQDAAGVAQPVTTRPELGLVQGFPVVFVGTGRYLGASDLTSTQTQSVYGFRDTGSNLGVLRSRADMVQQTITQVTPTARTTSNVAVDWSAGKGWFVDLNPGNESPGERVNTDPQLLQGTLLVSTNVLNSSACTIGGESWQYQFNFASGAYLDNAPVSESHPITASKIANALTVGAVMVRLPGGQLKSIITDASGTKHTTAVVVRSGAVGGRRISWRELFR